MFSDTLRWALDTGVDIVNLNVARPYPSTPMYAQLKREGRLTHDPWWLMPQDVRLEMVHGLTTAASIWLVASLGIACGAGQWAAALVACIIALLILTAGSRLEELVHRIFDRNNTVKLP